MSSLQATVQNIDDLTRFIANGYIREQQKLLEPNEFVLFQTIPDGIILLCALFFRWRDYFEIVPNYVTISQKENGDSCITSRMNYIRGDGGTNFGSISIPSNTKKVITEWDLKIEKKVFSALLVGISSKPFDPDKDCHVRASVQGDYHHSYMFANHGGGRSWYDNKWIRGGHTFKSDDIVTIKLNLDEKKVRLLVNGFESPLAFDVVCGDQIEYRLAVILFGAGNSVSIIKLTQTKLS